jgi:PAS domain-containing protein
VEELAQSLEIYRADMSLRPIEEAPPLRALRGEKVYNQEEVVRVPSSGKLRHRQVNAVPVVDASGKIIGAVSIVRDITKSKEEQENLRVSREQFLELFNNISSGVAIYEAKNNGEDFVFININKSGERLSKVKCETVIGRSVLEVFPGVVELGLFAVFHQVWKTGKPQHHPVSLYQDQRIAEWVENYVYKLPTGEIVAVYEDITERKQLEEKTQKQLRELEVFYKVSLNREERIIELKKEVESLKKKMRE